MLKMIQGRYYYFNPRSPHGERQGLRKSQRRDIIISTHAPRTGSDNISKFINSCEELISTHAPRTGSDKP